MIADHGAFNATAQPTKYPAGFFHVFTGSYDIEAAHCKVTGVYTNKAPGGVAYACSFRIAEAVYLVERMVDCFADELGIDPAELRLENLITPGAVPVPVRRPAGCTTPANYERRDAQGARDRRLRRPPPRAGREARARRADGDRRRLLHRGRRCRAPQAHGHPRPRHGRRGRPAGAPDRARRASAQLPVAGPGSRDDVRADRRRGARDPARGHRRRPRRHRRDAVRARHLRVALDAGERRRHRARRAQGARPGADRRGGDARGLARRPGVGEGPLVRQGRPREGRDDPGDRAGGARVGRAARRASRPASTPRPCTTRRT